MNFSLQELINTKIAFDKDHSLLEVKLLTITANHKLGNIICLIKRPYHDTFNLVFIDQTGKIIYQLVDQPKTVTQLYTNTD